MSVAGIPVRFGRHSHRVVAGRSLRRIVTTHAAPAPPASGDGEPPAGELRGLTGLRIVAAVWVVLFHFHFTPLPGVAEVVGVLGPLVTAGALGVDLFFVLSGFVIAHTYLDKLGPALRAGATARFVWARACRMWPVYALVFHLFGIWLVARLSSARTPRSRSRPCSRCCRRRGVPAAAGHGPAVGRRRSSTAPPGSGSTWSISAEWLAYLLFPVAALVFFRMRDLPAAVLGGRLAGADDPDGLGLPARRQPVLPVELAGPHPLRVRRRACWPTWSCAGCAAERRASDRVRRRASALAAALPLVIAAGLLAGELLGPGRGGAVIVLFPLLVGALALADRGPAMLLSRAVGGATAGACPTPLPGAHPDVRGVLAGPGALPAAPRPVHPDGSRRRLAVLLRRCRPPRWCTASSRSRRGSGSPGSASASPSPPPSPARSSSSRPRWARADQLGSAAVAPQPRRGGGAVLGASARAAAR